jgi:pimeloyl-ACP methyl ester carboxylesterase
MITPSLSGAVEVDSVASLLGQFAGSARLTSEADSPEIEARVSLPGYSAVLPRELCLSHFPNHRLIERRLMISGEEQRFELFSFTAAPFARSKPSLIAIAGGPGGVEGKARASSVAAAYPDFNVIFFHVRGAGCSPFPKYSAPWRAHLDSYGVISDIEAVRSAYGVFRWHGVLAWSYGTNIARRYANLHPDRMRLLILEGLDSPAESQTARLRHPLLQVRGARLPMYLFNALGSPTSGESAEELQTQQVLSIIESRLKKSPGLQHFVGVRSLQAVMDQVRSHFAEYPIVSAGWRYVSTWEYFDSIFEAFYQKKNAVRPKATSRLAFLAPVLLLYTGDTDFSEFPVAVLLDQLEIIKLPDEIRKRAETPLLEWELSVFPFRNPNYVRDFFETDSGMLVSSLVLSWLTANDTRYRGHTLCTSVPMIVINGSDDGATPARNVKKYLSDKACASAVNLSLVIQSGGHSDSISEACLAGPLSSALHAGRAVLDQPISCRLTIRSTTFEQTK